MAASAYVRILALLISCLTVLIVIENVRVWIPDTDRLVRQGKSDSSSVTYRLLQEYIDSEIEKIIDIKIKAAVISTVIGKSTGLR